MIDTEMNLTGRTAVVTGGSGVLCSCMGKALAQAGAKAALLGRNPEKLRAITAEITSAGYLAKGYECNVLDRDNMESVHQQILQDFGPCDILVNGAGGNNPKAATDQEFYHTPAKKEEKTFFDLEMDGIEDVFRLNYMGTLIPTQIFVKDMIGRKGCTIINISSMNAFLPLTKIPAYSSAKAAISNLTQWLAVHFSKEKIRCNAIAPGFFATPQNQSLLYLEDGSPSERSCKILTKTPMGRFGTPEELTGTLLYLASEKYSGFVNGAVIPVDGGFHAYSGV